MNECDTIPPAEKLAQFKEPFVPLTYAWKTHKVEEYEIEPEYTASDAFQAPTEYPVQQPDTEQDKIDQIASYIESAAKMATFCATLTRPQSRMRGYVDTAEMLELAALRLREVKVI